MQVFIASADIRRARQIERSIAGHFSSVIALPDDDPSEMSGHLNGAAAVVIDCVSIAPMTYFWMGCAYMLSLPIIGLKALRQTIRPNGPVGLVLLTATDSEAEIVSILKRLDAASGSIEDTAALATELKTEYRERCCAGTS